MYKAIFSDLDATLLNDDKKICQRNIEAINAAKRKGVKFLFCTGRLPFCYEMFKDDVDLSDAISTNGEIIYSGGKIIKASHLEKDDATALFEYAIKEKEYLRIFTFDYLYSLNEEKGGFDVNFYLQSAPVSDEEARKLLEEKTIYKVAFHASHERLLEIKKDISDLKLNVDMTFSNPKFLEVILQGESKGKGIIDYCRYNNIDIKDTIGVGDEENDFSMLNTVGLACCPKNASKEIKEVCDYICTADNNEGAIAEIIEKYVI